MLASAVGFDAPDARPTPKEIHPVIWAKTDAGRAEMQSKALIKERVQRNLLLLIDGQKSEEMLLANLSGVNHDDFATLQMLGLIEPVSGKGGVATSPAPLSPAPAAAAPAAAAPVESGLDYAQFTAALTQLISKELGLRGFTLTLAVEKANTIEQLKDVAEKTIAQIREKKGDPAAKAARRALFG
jgi:hypothetical protein